MIVAYLLSLAVTANPLLEAPSMVQPFTTVDTCLAVASKKNHSSPGVLFYCVQVVFPV